MAMPGVIGKKFALCKHPLWLLPADLGKIVGYSITYPLRNGPGGRNGAVPG